MVMYNDNSTPLPNPLSASQHAALEALGKGCDFQQAAAAAGVHRTTLYRWTQSDAEFRSAYTLWQQLAREETRVRLLARAQASASRVLELMEKDTKFAFKVIKEMGLLKPQPTVSVEVEDIRREIQLESLEREHQFGQRFAKLVRGQEANSDRAAEVKVGLPAGKMQQVVEQKSDPATSPQANAKPAAERAQPTPPAGAGSTNGGRKPNGRHKLPVLTDDAIASLPITGRKLTLDEALAVVGLEKSPNPAASTMLTGYLSQITQAAAQSAGAGMGRT